MTYRNDHDAAIARIDTLTQQLAVAEADRTRLRAALESVRDDSAELRDRRRIAELETARVELAAERDRLVVQLAGARAVRPRRRGEPAARIFAAILIIMVSLVVATASHARRHQRTTMIDPRPTVDAPAPHTTIEAELRAETCPAQ